MNFNTEGQVKFLVEETDRILGVHIIGVSPNAAPSCGARCNRLCLCSYFRSKCRRDDREGHPCEYSLTLRARHMHIGSSFTFPSCSILID